MKIHRKDTLKKVLTWLVAEIVLNTVGLDTLANYSEFVFEHPTSTQHCSIASVQADYLGIATGRM
jgi:hypothetical protein